MIHQTKNKKKEWFLLFYLDQKKKKKTVIDICTVLKVLSFIFVFFLFSKIEGKNYIFFFSLNVVHHTNTYV